MDPLNVSSSLGVATIRIQRPHRSNALDATTIAEIGTALARLEQDESTSAIVLTGLGTDSFCAGMDLVEFAERGVPSARVRGEGLERILDGSYPKPLIAAVNGPAVGLGFELVLCCDLVVAAEHAWFALPEVELGLFAEWGIVRLAERLAPPVAFAIAIGERLTAHRAEQLGLVNRVVAPEHLVDAAAELGAMVTRAAPPSLRATTQVLRLGRSDACAAAILARAATPTVLSARTVR